MSKKRLTYQDFKKYFSNHLQKKDKHAFEKQMMQDAFEEEAFDGLSQLSQFELGSDIAELKSNIVNRTKKTRRLIPVWFRYAASVIVLISIGFSIFFVNSRYWQDSMLKEQVSHEMEIADSMVVEAEQEMEKSAQAIDTNRNRPDQLIAESKELEEKKKEIEAKEIIVNDDINISDAFVSETDYEIAADEVEVIEFEEEEELVKEEFYVMESSVQEEQQIEELALNEEYTDEDRKVEITEKSAKKSPNIRIRGAASQSKNNEPLYVVDGKPVDLRKSKTIEGRIMSSDDKLAIPGVSVVLKDMTIFGTVSDSNGEFSLTVPDDEELKTLIASFVGMETQEISLENDSNLLVYMDNEMLEMDEVVVTTYGVRESKAASPVKVTAIPPESISRSKYKKRVIENIDYSVLSDFPGKYRIKVSFTVDENGELFNFNFRNFI